MNLPLRPLKIPLLLVALWLGWGAPAFGEVVVVVSQQNPVQTLTRTQLLNIFMGRPNQLANGKRAMPLDQAEGRPLREAFYREVLGKSNAEIKAHWSKIVFTGRGQPPRQFANDDEVKRFLAGNPDAIGYIDAASRTGELRIVTIAP